MHPHRFFVLQERILAWREVIDKRRNQSKWQKATPYEEAAFDQCIVALPSEGIKKMPKAIDSGLFRSGSMSVGMSEGPFKEMEYWGVLRAGNKN
jgi:hypothetical protein